MEVLSYKINLEEPQAPSLTSQALNAKNRLALQAHELTALAVLSEHCTLAVESAVAEEMRYEAVKDKLR